MQIRKNYLGLTITSLVLVFMCACTSTQTESQKIVLNSKPRTPAAKDEGDRLKYKTIFDTKDYKGMTFLAFMQDIVDPAIDKYATKGFKIADGDTVQEVLKNVGQKVYKGAMKDGGSEENLMKLADKMHQKGEMLTLYTLPDKIAAEKMGGNKYGLSTFLALASGGGVAVRLSDNNYYYNVNYGIGSQPKDEMTGRSFSSGPTRKADDVSDKDYLRGLEKYTRNQDEDISDFYRTLMQILVNVDSSGYSKISDEGQTVLTDFTAVYTAEEDRHLMSNLKTHHWDVALLEVTLLSAFHSGQDKIMVMYEGELTDSVFNQTPGCQEKPKEKRQASMIDWWQFSNSTDPKSCNRSGINITKDDFRALGKYISDYEREHNPDLVEKVEKHFTGIKKTGNLFQGLTDFLINLKTAKKLGQDGYVLADDFTDFLMQVRKDAKKINSYTLNAIKTNQ